MRSPCLSLVFSLFTAKGKIECNCQICLQLNDTKARMTNWKTERRSAAREKGVRSDFSFFPRRARKRVRDVRRNLPFNFCGSKKTHCRRTDSLLHFSSKKSHLLEKYKSVSPELSVLRETASLNGPRKGRRWKKRRTRTPKCPTDKGASRREKTPKPVRASSARALAPFFLSLLSSRSTHPIRRSV